MNGNYWLFVTPPGRKRAVIHWHGCAFCNDGRGVHDADHEVTKWYGPYASVADAEQQAQALGMGAFVRPCEQCGGRPPAQ